MEDDARPLARQHFLDQRPVLDVADDRRQRQLRKRIVQHRLNFVERGLGDVEKYDPRRPEARDLPRQFRADRSARAGDHDDAIAQPVGQSRTVEHDRVAAQQVVQFHIADGRERQTAADQVLVRRHRQRLHIGGGAQFGDAAADDVVCCRQRDDHLAHAKALGPRFEFRDLSQHADVAQQAALLRAVVVEQPHHAPLPAARQVLRESRR